MRRVQRLTGKAGAKPRLIVALIVAAAVLALPGGSAEAADSCPAGTSTEDAGAVLRVESCAGEVVVDSPAVRIVYGSSADDVIKAGPDVEAVYGGEGNDTIYADPAVAVVEGGAGADVIYGEPEADEVGVAAAPAESEGPSYQPAETGSAAPATASAITPVECTSSPCLGGNGAQLMRGGSGNDMIFGERGNDEIYGEGGEDTLYGGVGDDVVHGGEGNDYISGGNGADAIYGEAGNDLVQGDGTIDSIYGGTGTDTLSFATGVTPGDEGAYPSSVKHVEGFPEATSGEGRGVYVRIDGAATTCGYPSCDNGAGLGGGDDTIATSEIENVIGTAFPDIIVGSSAANKIYGGGGGDVIIGGGGADELYGGADGDYIEDGGSGKAYGGKGSNNCVNVGTSSECTGSKAKVTQPEPSKLSAGLMMVKNPVIARDTAYVTGSTGNDEVNASLSGTTVTFTSYGATRFGGESEGCVYEEEGKKAKCAFPVSSPSIDAIVMAGLGGNDHLAVAGGGFPLASGPILLGGEGNDTLVGSDTTEDVLIDGNGNGADTLEGRGYDDWLTNNGGVDLLEGGNGNDLILSTTTCGGDTIYGAEAENSDEAARNNASWAKLPAASGGVTAMLEDQSAGSYYDEAIEEPACTSGSPDTLIGIDDLEGSNQSDALFGNGGPNVLNGHHGQDTLYGEAGADEIEAQDEEKDKLGGGEGEDLCIVDREIDEWAGCEHTEPPMIATSVLTPTIEPHNGTPGSVTVKGNVSASEGALSGRFVNVNYFKEEGGKWVAKSTQHPLLNGSGHYETSEGVGVGNWRVKVVFPEQGPFFGSESAYINFTISK
jgi:Ca2+-binding RTX toxin-like protein